MDKKALKRKAVQVNDAVNLYFQKHRKVTEVKPGGLMPHLVVRGVFDKDQGYGLPLRDILTNLMKIDYSI